jgi:hypothetical protein
MLLHGQVMEAGSASNLRERQALLAAQQAAAEEAAEQHRPVDVKAALVDQLVQEVRGQAGSAAC